MRVIYAVQALACALFAMPMMTQSSAQMLDIVHATTPSRAIELRQKMIQTIWGGPKWHTAEFASSPGEDLIDLLGRSPETVTWLQWHWATGEPLGMFAGANYVTFPGASCLMIHHAGHGGGFSPVTIAAGQVALIKRLATANCDLILVSMPNDGDNLQFRVSASIPVDPSSSQHDALGSMPSLQLPVGNSLRYFLEPTLGALDYALAHKSYARVGMSGLSGGGWATTMIAAIDPRIQRSYSVAGSLPMAFHFDDPVTAGDWEQQLPDLYPGIDYPDLYLMAVAEPDRKAMLTHTVSDSCCFQAEKVKSYSEELAWYAQQTEFGPLSWVIVPNVDPPGHDIYPAAQDAIMADFLAP